MQVIQTSRKLSEEKKRIRRERIDAMCQKREKISMEKIRRPEETGNFFHAKQPIQGFVAKAL